MNCRHCESPLDLTLVDLGSAPPSNAYLTRETLKCPERWLPLRVLVCRECWLVQTEDFTRPEELFDPEYAYFSSFSSTWLDHCERYVDSIPARFGLGPESHVVEIAANDGYLLQFVKARGINCTGIEPTRAAAAAARAKGIPIIEGFFGARLAQELAARGKQADLMVANNVLAHVPDINDFVAGFTALLKPPGVVTFEFPHLVNLVVENQFDTIYHEHFSYLSLTAIQTIFRKNGLGIFDVEQHPTHGGSLRVFAQRSDTGTRPPTDSVETLLRQETRAGVTTADWYSGLRCKAEQAKNDFLGFLLAAKTAGKSVAAYGAAAKGNTLMNYAGVRPDLIRFVVDRNPAKQGKFMPGSRLPIVSEDRLRDDAPDYIVILPWNLRKEITGQLSYVKDWGGKFVTAIPRLEVM